MAGSNVFGPTNRNQKCPLSVSLTRKLKMVWLQHFPVQFCSVQLITLGGSEKEMDMLSKDHSFHPQCSGLPLLHYVDDSKSPSGPPFKDAVSDVRGSSLGEGDVTQLLK